MVIEKTATELIVDGEMAFFDGEMAFFDGEMAFFNGNSFSFFLKLF